DVELNVVKRHLNQFIYPSISLNLYSNIFPTINISESKCT
ncbi:MAG: hypothetical protein ACI8SE_000722, partial [Bacteroidia bacterium]